MKPGEHERPLEVTQRDRELAELFAQHTVARLLHALQDEDTVDGVINAWSGRVKQAVGGATLRAVFYIAGIALLIGSIKAGMIDSIINTFTIGKK